MEQIIEEPLKKKAAGPTMDQKNKKLLLHGKQLTKRFGNLVANSQVDLKVHEGEVHAILGENGAGKSTLMKMLYGVYSIDDGTLVIDGKNCSNYSPAKARELGIGMVFQDFRIVPALTVLENISLSHPKKGFFLKVHHLRKKIEETANRYGLKVNPDKKVYELDLGERQRVEILKVLMNENTKLVIFDEPTSVLTPHEVDAFLKMVQKLRLDGYGVLLITHKIKEVMAVADTVSVLHSGKLVYHADKGEEWSEDELVSQMIGEKEIPSTKVDAIFQGEKEEYINVKNLHVIDDRGYEVLNGINFHLGKGEIVGVAGVSGNGQRELMECLFGIRVPKSGSVKVKGIDLTGKGPESFINQKVAYISEDPIAEQVVPGLSILEHMVLGGLEVTKKGLGIDWKSVRSSYNNLEIKDQLKVAESNRNASTLSGGNVQRMVLARALASNPDILLVSYPSRGLDIVTVKTIQQILKKIKAQGTSVVLISEDLNEIYELSDRIVVLSQTKLYGSYDPNEMDAYSIGRVMLEGDR